MVFHDALGVRWTAGERSERSEPRERSESRAAYDESKAVGCDGGKAKSLKLCVYEALACDAKAEGSVWWAFTQAGPSCGQTGRGARSFRVVAGNASCV